MIDLNMLLPKPWASKSIFHEVFSETFHSLNKYIF